MELAHKKCTLHPAAASERTQTVTLESGLGDIEYQFEFDKRQDPDIAKRFASAVRGDIALGERMEMKKKLGHEKDSDTRKSVRYACIVAENNRSHEEEEQQQRGDERLASVGTIDNVVLKESYLSGGLEVLGF